MMGVGETNALGGGQQEQFLEMINSHMLLRCRAEAPTEESIHTDLWSISIDSEVISNRGGNQADMLI